MIGRVTIVADSGHSQIVESLGLNTERRVFGSGRIISHFLENVDCPYPHSFIRFMGGKTQSRAYMLPKPPKKKGDPIRYEILTRSEELFRQIIHDEKYFPWFKNSQIVRQRAAAGVLRAPIKNPFKGKVILTGDAASWQEVEIQGALMCGYRASKAASQELEKGEDALHQYTHFWNCAFEFCWPNVVERSMKFFRMHNTLFTDQELDYVYQLTQNDKVPGTVNHFHAGAHELRTYIQHLDRIRTENLNLRKNWWIFSGF